MNVSRPFILFCACIGGTALGLTAAQSLSLTLGSVSSRFCVGLLLILFALLALFLLRRAGCDRETLCICLLPIGLAMLLRLLMLDHQTLDYQWFLSQWAATFREGGGFAMLKEPIGNYNIPYLYFLALISYVDIHDLYLIKCFSILFDVILAWGVLRLVRLMTGKDSFAPAVSFCITLLLPTVLLNGACWGQCDAIYGALVLHALASALEHRPASSLILLSLAFSFKLQAIFLVPLWCVLWYSGRVRFRHLTLFPIAYVITMLPAFLLGKPIRDIVGVYLGQAGSEAQHGSLNYNSPSLFGFLPYGSQPNIELGAKLGILAAFLLVILLLVILFFRRDSLSDRSILLAGLVLAIGVPFFLPYMHERYFFLADLLALTAAVITPRRTLPAAMIQISSLGGYHAYLRGRYLTVISLFGVTFTMLLESGLMLFSLLLAILALKNELTSNTKRPGRA